MSGPQGPDPTQPWPGQQPSQPAEAPSSDPSAGQPWQQPASGSDPTTAAPAWQQPPAYDPQQQQYPQYPQQPAYQPPQQYGQQPTEYNPQAYPQPGQYGQPGQYAAPGQQYGQQYGQPGQYPQQPGQYGYTAPGAEEGSKRSLAVILSVLGIFVLIVAAVVVVFGVFVPPKFFVTTELDIDAAQTGVQRILTDEANGYGAKNVQNVKCNDGQNPKVEKGGTFDCEVSIDGTKRQVTVTFQDDDGTYEVGRPK